jgi:hypothetical protein
MFYITTSYFFYIVKLSISVQETPIAYLQSQNIKYITGNIQGYIKGFRKHPFIYPLILRERSLMF